MLLASCGSGDSQTVNISNESEITSSEGEAKLEAIEANLENAITNKCAVVTDSLESGDFSISSGGVEIAMNLKRNMDMHFDTIDNELYGYQSVSITIKSDSSSIADVDSKEEMYAYYFDGVYAQKNITIGVRTSRNSVHRDMDVANSYALTVNSLIVGLDDYSWTDVTYYGNSNDYDLRVAATGENNASLDFTFADGLLTNFVLTNEFPVSTFGYPSSRYYCY